MNEVIPGILEKDWPAIEEKIRTYLTFVNKIHVDFIDGKFVANTTCMDFAKFLPYSQNFFLEAHLMAEEPINYLKPLSQAGFKRFVGHIEKMSDQTEFVVKAQEFGEVGLAVDFKTPLEEIKVAYEDLDTVLIMGVNAGSSGQTFLADCLPKISRIRSNSLVSIEVDGGINDTNIGQIATAGANIFISTSYISANPKENFEKLLSLI